MTKFIKHLFALVLLPMFSTAQIHISGTGEIVAAGTAYISLTGDWTNNSTGTGYTSSTTGWVYMVGSSQQNINGSKTTNFSNIKMKNPAGVLLNTDIRITEALSFQKGIIHGNSHVVYFEGNGKSDNGTINRFIEGAVSRTGTGNFRFEVGKAGKFAPLATFGMAGQTGTMSVEYFYKATPPNNTSFSSPLVKVSDVEYWHMNSSLTGQVRLHWKDSRSGIKSIDPNLLKFAKWDGSNWVDEVASIYASASTTSGYIRTNAAISLSNLDITFGSTDNVANPLPIQLLSFTAQCQEQDVVLNWSTASEENNNYFTLLRSKDAEHFEEIAQITGAGNSNEVLNYSYADYNAAAGNYYYMLKQTDYNGESETFEPIFVNCKQSKEVELKVLYDGEQAYAVLNNAQSGSSYNMIIIDYTGRVVVEQKQVVNAQNYYRIPSAQLASGIYTIIYFTDDGSTRLNEKFYVR